MTFYYKRYISFIAILLLLISLSTQAIHAFPAGRYAEQSVLSSGKWVKIKVGESGIYAITANDAQSWGFSNINSLKIFGYGGAPLSIDFNKCIDDLEQIPVMNTGKQIIFYAQGPTTIEQKSTIEYIQRQHPFSTAGYYFVTDRSDISQLAVSKSDNNTPNGGSIITEFTEIAFHETESVSLTESGNKLFGEDFRFSKTQGFSISLPGYKSGTDIKVLTSFAAKTMGAGSKLTFNANGTTLDASGSDEIQPLSNTGYELYKTTETLKTFAVKDAQLDYVINYSSTGTVLQANLDFITVNYTRNLELNNSLCFRSNNSRGNIFEISNASENTCVWDLSTPNAPVQLSGSLNGKKYRVTAVSNGEHAAFNSSARQASPAFVGKIANQDIHGEPTPDMIIISPAEFLSQAQRVADLHLQLDSMRVLVVDQQKVFNEFSSGTPDFLAYRNMAKMFYDRGTDENGHKLGYILLFGRGTYDNRQLSSAVRSLRYPMLLTWQSDNSSSEIESYSTDDVVTMLEDNQSMNIAHNKMSIAVGRMPVKSTTEAKEVVDKLYYYTTKQDFGTWKNNVLMIADDMNNAIHMEQADAVIANHKAYGGDSYVYNRIYLDAFTVESSGAGRSFPEARKRLYQKLNEGVLYLNYIGHSGNVEWTGDGLLGINDINNMYLKHYPLFLTASCEFTRLDKSIVTGGEMLFLNPRGGAIALISTARQVLITDNGYLNKTIAKYMFARDANGYHYRIGDILKNGKNDIGISINKLKYFMVGDPALRLAYPTFSVNLESINGEVVNNDNMPEFKARQTMTIKGSIIDTQGNKATTFNGEVIPTLYDIEESIVTHGYGDDGKEYTFLDRSNKLSITKGNVVNGEFCVDVAIPSEINAPSAYDNFTPAMLNFYASSNDGIEANGNNEQFYIYGYEDEAVTDTIGPRIGLFVINSESFKNGDNVNESPLVIASVNDDSGINLSNSGIGHQITLTLDGATTYSDVSSYYTPDFAENGNSGNIYYSLNNLAEGNHTLKIKVWDTFNNSSEQTINFNVIQGLKPVMHDVFVVGNPAKTDAKFYIKHNRPDALITVTLYVYDLMGKLVWSTVESGRSDMFTSFPITWNLTDMAGRRVPRGIYVYKAGISTDGVQEITKAKKMAVAAE